MLVEPNTETAIPMIVAPTPDFLRVFSITEGGKIFLRRL